MADAFLALSILAGWLFLYRPQKQSRREWYRSTYLWSKHWRATRLKKLQQVGFRCEKCKRGGKLDVHHLTYKRIGKERMSDLEVLCRSCHKKEHRK